MLPHRILKNKLNKNKEMSLKNDQKKEIILGHQKL